jgi:hypothetical protein
MYCNAMHIVIFVAILHFSVECVLPFVHGARASYRSAEADNRLPNIAAVLTALTNVLHYNQVCAAQHAGSCCERKAAMLLRFIAACIMSDS